MMFDHVYIVTIVYITFNNVRHTENESKITIRMGRFSWKSERTVMSRCKAKGNGKYSRLTV